MSLSSKESVFMSINVIKRIAVAVIAAGIIFSLTACNDPDDKKPVTKTTSTTTTPTSIPIATIPETTLYVFLGPMVANDQAVTWQEQALPSSIIKKVNITSDFLRVRKGPGTEYEQVAALTKGMQVIVVSKTANGWYKLDDGYYVSGEFLSDT